MPLSDTGAASLACGNKNRIRQVKGVRARQQADNKCFVLRDCCGHARGYVVGESALFRSLCRSAPRACVHNTKSRRGAPHVRLETGACGWRGFLWTIPGESGVPRGDLKIYCGRRSAATSIRTKTKRSNPNLNPTVRHAKNKLNFPS